MKILCVCQEGNKRSVVTRFLLNHSQHEALACGVETNSQETLKMLCTWADIILVAEPKLWLDLPREAMPKIDMAFTIGVDTYPSNIDKKLYRLIKKQLIELGYI